MASSTMALTTAEYLQRIREAEESIKNEGIPRGMAMQTPQFLGIAMQCMLRLLKRDAVDVIQDVPIQPPADAVPGRCYDNVARFVKNNEGFKPVGGWLLSQALNGQVCMREHYAIVYNETTKQYIDVTPSDGNECIWFLLDNTYDVRRLAFRRLNGCICGDIHTAALTEEQLNFVKKMEERVGKARGNVRPIFLS